MRAMLCGLLRCTRWMGMLSSFPAWRSACMLCSPGVSSQGRGLCMMLRFNACQVEMDAPAALYPAILFPGITGHAVATPIDAGGIMERYGFFSAKYFEDVDTGSPTFSSTSARPCSLCRDE